jgi:hypothetical protein
MRRNRRHECRCWKHQVRSTKELLVAFVKCSCW